jgi:hypothetical protein
LIPCLSPLLPEAPYVSVTAPFSDDLEFSRNELINDYFWPMQMICDPRFLIHHFRSPSPSRVSPSPCAGCLRRGCVLHQRKGGVPSLNSRAGQAQARPFDLGLGRRWRRHLTGISTIRNSCLAMTTVASEKAALPRLNPK